MHIVGNFLYRLPGHGYFCAAGVVLGSENRLARNAKGSLFVISHRVSLY